MSFTPNSLSDKEALEGISRKIASEKANVAHALKNFHMGHGFTFDSSQRYMTFESTFKPVVEALQSKLAVKAPIYLLLDDVNNLHDYQQRQINTWLGQRDHNIVCFKVASEPLEHRTFRTLSDTGMIQRLHDYNEIVLDFDFLFSQDERISVYSEIANRRISHFSPNKALVSSLEELLPLSKEQEDELKIIAKGLKEGTNDSLGTDWELLHRRRRRVYAGVEDIAILAFGNIREFLLICDEIFPQGYDFGADDVRPVESESQHEILCAHSKEYLKRLSSLDTIYAKDDIDEKLENLVRNLLEFFKYRLYEADFLEKSYTAFTVIGLHSLPEEAKSVLRRGIERQFFRKTFSSRKDGGRQDVFVLNKMLFPEYLLNIRVNIEGKGVGYKYQIPKSVFIQTLNQGGVLVDRARAKKELDPNQMTINDLEMIHSDAEEGYEYEYGRLF